MALILLRNLPGVDVVEYRYEEAGEWTELVEAWADQLAEDLFGISEYDIDEEDEALEARFQQVFSMMRDESDAYWASHGWDVTDGKGKQLAVMDVLTRPMVCLVEKLHPEARFTHATEAWGKSLEEEAKNWRPKR